MDIIRPYRDLMTLHDTFSQLDLLAGHIDRFGYDDVAQQYLRQLRRPAMEAGVPQPMVDLFTDTATPTPVRNRAFGHIASLIARHLRRGDHSACAA